MASEMKLRHLRGSENGAIWVLATEDEYKRYWAMSPTNCEHDETELRDFRTSNGGWQRKQQCKRCGAPASQSLPRDKSIAVPMWDYAAVESWEADCHAKQSTLEGILISRTNSSESSGYVFYEDYLKSAEWKALRERIMIRDKELCQGCLKEIATDIHHLTYDNIFREFTFELIAVCRSCHTRLHKKKIAALEAARAKGLDVEIG